MNPENETKVLFINPIVKRDWKIRHTEINLIKEIGKVTKNNYILIKIFI